MRYYSYSPPKTGSLLLILILYEVLYLAVFLRFVVGAINRLLDQEQHVKDGTSTIYLNPLEQTIEAQAHYNKQEPKRRDTSTTWRMYV